MSFLKDLGDFIREFGPWLALALAVIGLGVLLIRAILALINAWREDRRRASDLQQQTLSLFAEQNTLMKALQAALEQLTAAEKDQTDRHLAGVNANTAAVAGNTQIIARLADDFGKAMERMAGAQTLIVTAVGTQIDEAKNVLIGALDQAEKRRDEKLRAQAAGLNLLDQKAEAIRQGIDDAARTLTNDNERLTALEQQMEGLPGALSAQVARDLAPVVEQWTAFRQSIERILGTESLHSVLARLFDERQAQLEETLKRAAVSIADTAIAEYKKLAGQLAARTAPAQIMPPVEPAPVQPGGTT